MHAWLHKGSTECTKTADPKKAKAVRTISADAGASYDRLRGTVLFTVPLIRPGTTRGLPISKG